MPTISVRHSGLLFGALIMKKQYLPGRAEVIAFAILAVVLALVVEKLGTRDAMTSLLTFPVFVGAAIWGLWKHGRLRA